MNAEDLERRTLFANEFASGLRKRRVRLENFGAEMRYGAPALQNWASGKTLPSGPIVKYICDTLHMNYQRAAVCVALDKLEGRFGPLLWKVIGQIGPPHTQKVGSREAKGGHRR